jgi:hypothetical protein
MADHPVDPPGLESEIISIISEKLVLHMPGFAYFQHLRVADILSLSSVSNHPTSSSYYFILTSQMPRPLHISHNIRFA